MIRKIKIWKFFNITLRNLSKKGDSRGILSFIQHIKQVDNDQLLKIITTWMQYNKSVITDSALSSMIKGILMSNPKLHTPEIAEIKELVGNYNEAALLYKKNKEIKKSAYCYEQDNKFSEALKLYIDLEDHENISRMYEELGDYKNSLKYVENPKRKVTILIKLEQFSDAKQFVLDSLYDEDLIDEIKCRALEIMNKSIKLNNFIYAMELSNVVESTDAVKKEILKKGRLYCKSQLNSAKNHNDIKKIYSKLIELEESAGEFDEAAKIAEEILKDKKLASFLYEKAKLFNRAIECVQDEEKENDDSLDSLKRLAILHEKGGNLIESAKLYNKIGEFDKAYQIYNEIGDYSNASKIYYKTNNLDDETLIKLHLLNEEYNQVIDLLLKQNNIKDYHKALVIAEDNNLVIYKKKIQKLIDELTNSNEVDIKLYYQQAIKNVKKLYCLKIGVDFGTSNSVASIYNIKSKKVEIVPIPGKYNEYYEPSLFGVDENNNYVFGYEAKNLMQTNSDTVVACVKREITSNKTYSLNNNNFKPQEVAGYIINRMKTNAERYLTSKIEEELEKILSKNEVIFSDLQKQELTINYSSPISIEEVVLSVPAYFNDSQKRAIRDAAKIADLKVARLINEPTAAGIAYINEKGNYINGECLVVDLGGGTLDVSIMEIGEEVLEVKALGGDNKLGGIDIDNLIYKHFANLIKKKYGKDVNKSTEVEKQRLLENCEKLKIYLSSSKNEKIEIIHFLNLPKCELILTRGELEELTEPIIERIVRCVKKTTSKHKSKINYILFVGNATNMPVIQDRIKKIHKNSQVLRGVPAGLAVANGAGCQSAILSGDIKDRLILDVTPLSLGIALKDDMFEILIEEDTTIPTTKNKRYTTTEDNQTKVDIIVYQGENSLASNNKLIGKFVLDGIIPDKKGVPQIDVSFNIDANGVLTVKAKDKKTTHYKEVQIIGTQLLTPNEIKKYRDKLTTTNNLEEIKSKIVDLQSLLSNKCIEFYKKIDSAERLNSEFLELFSEKVEKNPHLYDANKDQTISIQKMFSEKSIIQSEIITFKDHLNIISLKNTNATKNINISIESFIEDSKEISTNLNDLNNEVVNLIKTFTKDVLEKLSEYKSILVTLMPDENKTEQKELAKSFLLNGNFKKSKSILESIIDTDEFDLSAFNLLLRCYRKLMTSELYFDLQKTYSKKFNLIIPNFENLDSFLKEINKSIFLIKIHKKHIVTGTGFSVSKNKIVTNRHVVDGVKPEEIEILNNKEIIFKVVDIELDMFNDLAILTVKETLTYLRIGEFKFASPGQKILAVGFPAPNAFAHNDMIYISHGIINSIRLHPISPERVLFFDAKVGPGMSGGPIINSVGEVIGITTLGLNDVALGGQPVAIPISLVEKILN